MLILIIYHAQALIFKFMLLVYVSVTITVIAIQ